MLIVLHFHKDDPVLWDTEFHHGGL